MAEAPPPLLDRCISLTAPALAKVPSEERGICGICLGNFLLRDLSSPPCKHHLCHSCLLSLLLGSPVDSDDEGNMPDGYFTCPSCRAVFLRGQELTNLAGLQTFATEVFFPKFFDKEPPKCSTCKSTDAAKDTVHCFQCRRRFCPTCISKEDSSHKPKEHTVVRKDMKSVLSALKSLLDATKAKCDELAGEKYEGFPKTASEFVLENVYPQFLEQLKQQLDDTGVKNEVQRQVDDIGRTVEVLRGLTQRLEEFFALLCGPAYTQAAAPSEKPSDAPALYLNTLEQDELVCLLRSIFGEGMEQRVDNMKYMIRDKMTSCFEFSDSSIDKVAELKESMEAFKNDEEYRKEALERLARDAIASRDYTFVNGAVKNEPLHSLFLVLKERREKENRPNSPQYSRSRSRSRSRSSERNEEGEEQQNVEELPDDEEGRWVLEGNETEGQFFLTVPEYFDIAFFQKGGEERILLSTMVSAGLHELSPAARLTAIHYLNHKLYSLAYNSSHIFVLSRAELIADSWQESVKLLVLRPPSLEIVKEFSLTSSKTVVIKKPKDVFLAANEEWLFLADSKNIAKVSVKEMLAADSAFDPKLVLQDESIFKNPTTGGLGGFAVSKDTIFMHGTECNKKVFAWCFDFEGKVKLKIPYKRKEGIQLNRWDYGNGREEHGICVDEDGTLFVKETEVHAFNSVTGAYKKQILSDSALYDDCDDQYGGRLAARNGRIFLVRKNGVKIWSYKRAPLDATEDAGDAAVPMDAE